MSNAPDQLGPCNSGIRYGFPIRDCDADGPVIKVGYSVPADKLCCFYRHLFGDWRIHQNEVSKDDVPSAGPSDSSMLPCCMEVFVEHRDFDYYPGPCHLPAAIHIDGEVAMRAVGVSTRKATDKAGVWTDGATKDISDPVPSIASDSNFVFRENEGKEFDGDSYPPWTIASTNNTTCWLDVDVTYRMVRIQVPEDFIVRAHNDCTGTIASDSNFLRTVNTSRVEHEEPLVAPYPTTLKIAKESGVDFRTTDDASVEFCKLFLAPAPTELGSKTESDGSIDIVGEVTCEEGNVCVSWTLDPPPAGEISIPISVEAPVASGLPYYTKFGKGATGEICFENVQVAGPTAVGAQANFPAGPSTTFTLSTRCDTKSNACCTATPENSISAKPIQTDRVQVD